ncbi:BON domain-containing protein [bacterium]|nr:MAG: BON domain-containing protein [bacterium]
MEIKNNMKATLLSFGAIAVLLLGGCTQEAREKYDAAGDSAANAAAKTGDAVATDAKETGEAIEKTGEAAVEATKDVAENVADSTMTPKVKTQILNTADLEAKNINVETKDNVITLKGSVPTAEQKKKAEDAAKLAAGKEFKVDNQLTVAGS